MGDGNLDIPKIAKEIALGQGRIHYDPLTMNHIYIDDEGNRMLINHDNYIKIVEYYETHFA